MNTSMHNKLIRLIDLDPMWTQHGHPERITAGDGRRLLLSATHHGDHDEFWIVEEVDGQETHRFSASAVKHIEWQR